MKKLLPALVALLAFAAVAASLYLFRKSKRAGEATTSVVAYLPADTLLLLSIPDLGRTVAAWKTTDLYKIWLEPEVQTFLTKPLSQLPPGADYTATLTHIAKLELKNGFVALTALDEKTSRPHLVAGFQFTGSSADVDSLLATPKEQLRQHFPSGKADLINHAGHAIETFNAGDDNFLASVYLGNWYLVANDVALLESTLDRVEGLAPASGQPTLAKETDFLTVLSKMPSGHDTIIFARAQPFISRLYALAAASGQTVDQTQRAAAEKVRAVAATTTIEHGKLRDTMYCLAPGHEQSPATLRLGSLPLTSADTIFFGSAIFNLPAQFDLPAGLPPGAPGADGLAALHDLGAMLEAHGMKWTDLRAAFGNETTLQLEWPAGRLYPGMLASIDVRDKGAAGKIVNQLVSTPIPEAAWEASQSDGLSFHTLSSPQVRLVQPTLTLTDKHAVFGLALSDVHDAAVREKSNVPNFTQGEPYKTAAAAVAKPNVAFAYLDTHAFFERFYGTLKPVAFIGAALVFPKASEYVDLGKLPSVEVVSRHLSPTIFSQTSDQQGILIESTGSFTFGEAAAVLVGGAGAIAFPLMEQQGFIPPVAIPSAPAQPAPDQ